ncbi:MULTISPECIES: homogentisate phytyltransferase [unclassified Tolypothrix]|uniref:homogentisate phytyltransferase n=1 Tax=unclassified Tolypothrix TaxID=2649714 RepID=UPI0005EAB2C9|nr:MULTISPECIES: homogentisate phytyltransferase [unclassified Tolypothrix]BAY91900.1 tocopherol phytyltransferase [Microchaete diplosiphon NIES-3275]EKF04929.1 dimethylallyltranstransferase [Tolypothrix sp. PCC 7601]MBE9086986.1 homogentisate phytyltransferase [Tolypothrix sp. LEGE 11397]UYD25902.1 homogentisate phytyltransferase [Tolypothrix sp. PCC 7712]UYD31859.1 homogentisate phytyltransferase [Tolypothrix sp. PCC 7601]
MNQYSGQKPFGVWGRWLDAFWQFSRPHTIIGTSLSVLALYLIAVAVGNSNYAFSAVLATWFACLCGNVYIVGLNQLEDIEIDKINKPHLPLASGDFSKKQGQIIVAITGVLALVIAALSGPFLFGMVAISLAIGTAYSLPPIRLKRFPFWAAFCIFSVRGTIVNLGLFLHFSWLAQKNTSIPATVWVLTVFILVFTFAIAIFKDVPDMEGDRLYNIRTLTIHLGPQAVFNLALGVLTICYVGMILVGVLRLASVNILFLVITHLVVLCVLWVRSLGVDLQEKSAIAQFYQFIWKLFFIEYLIFPIACLLA